MATVETRFWEFNQNNSGGSFDKDDERGIGPRVWIEACDVGHANYRALQLGIYFNGIDAGRDCPCCGDRWSDAWGDGETKPDISQKYDFTWHPTVYVHRLDGTIERIAQKAIA